VSLFEGGNVTLIIVSAASQFSYSCQSYMISLFTTTGSKKFIFDEK